MATNGTTALITSGTRGIGVATAKSLAQAAQNTTFAVTEAKRFWELACRLTGIPG